MAIPLRCRCGTLRGEIEPASAFVRVTCYCRDCQAFARVLGREDVLDPRGGTDLVALLPAGTRLIAGEDKLACLSLGPKGLLRWYATCCDTPIANTPRDPKLPYVGVLAASMADPSALDAAVGPSRVALGTDSARGEVQSTPARTGLAVVRIMWGMLLARLRGRHRDNPFFQPGTNRPVREPRVLTREERAAATPD